MSIILDLCIETMANAKIEELLTQMKSFEQDSRDSGSRVSNLEEELLQIKEEREEKISDLRNLRSALDLAKKEGASLTKKVEELSDQLANSQTDFRELQNDAEKKQSELRKSISELETKLKQALQRDVIDNDS